MKSSTSQIVHQRLIDRGAVELEGIEVLGQRQLGNGELVLDRACLLLVELGLEEIADDALRLMLAFDGGGHDLIVSGLHAVELEFAHEFEHLGPFHQIAS